MDLYRLYDDEKNMNTEFYKSLSEAEKQKI